MSMRPESKYYEKATEEMEKAYEEFKKKGEGVEDEEAKKFYDLLTEVPRIAYEQYKKILDGEGIEKVEVDGKEIEVPVARYEDWEKTTPLLLEVLANLVDASEELKEKLISKAKEMITLGKKGALETDPEKRFEYWKKSTEKMNEIIDLLENGFKENLSSLKPERKKTYEEARKLTIELWSKYPEIWKKGPLGEGKVPLEETVKQFTELDVSAKVGFGELVLSSEAIYSGSGHHHHHH
uniref:soluble bacteriorhodopsin n=1 Tax=synthetic construct TaxID=32630 RepID=UPI003D81C59F